MHNGDMPDGRGSPVREALTSVARSVTDRVKRWRGNPPEEAGVREPRRPRPNLPAASVALDEPRIGLYRRFMKRDHGHETGRP
jgi:hypothetical protein